MPIQTGPLIPAPQYISYSDADDYFSTRLNSDIWFNATAQQKNAALVTATRAIDRLNFVGTKADDTQQLEFPRRGTATSTDGLNFTQGPVIPVPSDVLIACCEEAIVRLDDTDPEFEMASLNVASTAYGTVRDTYDRTFVIEAVRAGIMSEVAWTFLTPWLADPLSLALSRAN